jgi:hypothetical protein
LLARSSAFGRLAKRPLHPTRGSIAGRAARDIFCLGGLRAEFRRAEAHPRGVSRGRSFSTVQFAMSTTSRHIRAVGNIFRLSALRCRTMHTSDGEGLSTKFLTCVA